MPGDADALREARGGQQHVGAGERRGGEEQVHHHVELHLLQRRQDALGLGAHAGDGVVLHHEHGLDGVGLARLHGLEQGVGADAVHGLEGLVAAVVLALGMGDGLGALVPHRAARRPGDRHAEGGVGGEHAARVLEVAGERHEVEARHAGDEALGGVVHGHAPLQAARLRAPDLAGRLHDEVLGHAAGLGGEAHGVLPHVLGELVEAVAPAAHELVVVEVVLDYLVAERERQRRVGAGAQLEPHVGLAREPGERGVHDDELAAALHALHHPVAERAVGVGHHRVVAPYEDVLGRLPARVVVAVGEELRVVAHEQPAALERGGEDARRVTRLARQEPGAVVGRAQVLGHERPVAVDVAAGALRDPDGLVAELLDDGLHLPLDDVVGLLPADTLEGVLAAVLLGALHGVAQAVLMVEHLLHGQAPGAEAPLVVGVRRVALDLLKHPVPHVQQHAAVVVAARARARVRAQHRAAVLLPRPLASARVVLRGRRRHALGGVPAC